MTEHPPKPSERRFQPPTEKKAKERLDAFRKNVKEFQKKNPEILGATVFGSMIKGQEASETSDIDGFLYIDDSTIPEKNRRKSRQGTEEEYRTLFLESSHLSYFDAHKYYKDLTARVLNEKDLEKEINDYAKFIIQITEYFNDESEVGKIEDKEKETQITNTISARTLNNSTVGIFHAQVGRGIEKYRRFFLKKLLTFTNKKDADYIWKAVYLCLKKENEDCFQKLEKNKMNAKTISLERLIYQKHSRRQSNVIILICWRKKKKNSFC